MTCVKYFARFQNFKMFPYYITMYLNSIKQKKIILFDSVTPSYTVRIP